MKRYAQLGQALKQRREVLGVTQVEVAAHLNMTRANVSLLEGGKIRTPLETLAEYAEFIGTSLICDLAEGGVLAPEVRRLPDLWQRLPADKRRILIALLHELESQYPPEQKI